MGPWSDGEIIVHEMRRGRNAKKVPEYRGRAQGTLTSQSAAGAVQGGTGSAGKEEGGECRGVAERLIGWRGGGVPCSDRYLTSGTVQVTPSAADTVNS